MQLGNATAAVIQEFAVHPAAAGWILGTVTSLPEMVTFFAVYLTAQGDGTLDELEDTQEVLDNLTGSNMANVGVVYPAGLFAFLVATTFLL
jgi:Ca2+/Na+ antiporter